MTRAFRIATLGDCLALLCASLFCVGIARAADPPDAAVNPVNGSIELTDTIVDGEGSQIRHIVKPLDGIPESALLSDGSVSDLAPRIDIKADGNTWVVWWRDAGTPAVILRIHDQETDAWGDEIQVSGEEESASHPTITHDGLSTWVAYEIAGNSGTSIAVKIIDDGADPFPTATVVATTSFTDADALIQSESGHVWTTWIDSATQVKWSVYDSQTATWSTPQAVSYQGSSVEDTRKAIRIAVLED